MTIKNEQSIETDKCVIKIRVAHLLMFCVLLLCVFALWVRVVIAAYTRCSVRLYLQLSVRGIMSYQRYLCLLADSGVQRTLSWVFLFSFWFFSLFCVTCVASFYRLSILGASNLSYPYPLILLQTLVISMRCVLNENKSWRIYVHP